MSALERMGGEVVQKEQCQLRAMCPEFFVDKRGLSLPRSSRQKSRGETEDSRAVDQIFFTDLA
jgi:hypothetical protein